MNKSNKIAPSTSATMPATEISPTTPGTAIPAVDPSPGTFDTDGEQDSLQTCEVIMAKGLQAFVAAGLAFAGIRDQRLYRGNFPTFDAYCRQKWHRGARSVNRLISAAQIFTHLAATCPQHKPDRQIQIRSLVGLTPEQAQLAWEQAAANAGAGRITERHVKSAVEELQSRVRSTPVGRTTRTPKANRMRTLATD